MIDWTNTCIGVTGYNNPHLLAECLDAVLQTNKLNLNVVYIDDGSYAWNVRMVRNRFPVEILENKINCGVAYSRNRFWQHAIDVLGRPNAITIDMDIIVQPGWIEALMETANKHSNCGIAALPVCNNEGGHFPVRADGCVAEIASMAALYRVNLFTDFLGPDDVWGMDTRMKLFSHDSEFCQRMKNCSQWRIYLTDKEYCQHKHGGHHSVKSASPTWSADVGARRTKDCQIWCELNGSRGWEEKKEIV
jgi:GT2 family glycosyltransferase